MTPCSVTRCRARSAPSAPVPPVIRTVPVGGRARSGRPGSRRAGRGRAAAVRSRPLSGAYGHAAALAASPGPSGVRRAVPSGVEEDEAVPGCSLLGAARPDPRRRCQPGRRSSSTGPSAGPRSRVTSSQPAASRPRAVSHACMHRRARRRAAPAGQRAPTGGGRSHTSAAIHGRDRRRSLQRRTRWPARRSAAARRPANSGLQRRPATRAVRSPSAVDRDGTREVSTVTHGRAGGVGQPQRPTLSGAVGREATRSERRAGGVQADAAPGERQAAASALGVGVARSASATTCRAASSSGGVQAEAVGVGAAPRRLHLGEHLRRRAARRRAGPRNAGPYS